MVSTPVMIDDPSPVEAFKHDSLPFAVSVGLHALVLGLLLPNLSAFSTGDPADSPNNPRNVSVIELSPAEQSRLPNLSPTASPLPPNNASFPPFAPLAGSLPIDATGYPPSTISALPPPPSLPPLTYNNTYPFPVRTAPNPAFLPFRNYPTPPNSLRPPTPLNPAEIPNQAVNPTPLGERPQFPPLRSPVSPDDLINGRGQQTQSGENGSSNGQFVAANPSSAPQFPPVSPEDVRFNGENTSDDDAMRNNVRWMAKAGTLKPQAIEMTGNYPIPACPSQVNGSAIIGVATNAQGQVTGEPTLIKSSGFRILDRQAFQDAQSQKGLGQGAYRITVNYDYSPKICPAVAKTQPNLPALPTDTPSLAPSRPSVSPANTRPLNPTGPQDTRVQPKPVPSPEEARRAPTVKPPSNGAAPPSQNQPKSSPQEARREPPAVKIAPENVPSSRDLQPIPTPAPNEASNGPPLPTTETPSTSPLNSSEPATLAPAASKKSAPSPAQVDPQVNEPAPRLP